AFTTSFAVITGGLALFLERQPGLGFNVRQVGWVYGVSGFVGGLVQGGAIKRLVKRFGGARLALMGFLAMGAVCPVLAVRHSIPGLMVVVVLGSSGGGVVRPGLTTLMTRSVGRDEQGSALGTSQSLASISQIVGPETAGFLIQHGQLWAYGAAAGLVA